MRRHVASLVLLLVAATALKLATFVNATHGDAEGGVETATSTTFASDTTHFLSPSVPPTTSPPPPPTLPPPSSSSTLAAGWHKTASSPASLTAAAANSALTRLADDPLPEPTPITAADADAAPPFSATSTLSPTRTHIYSNEFREPNVENTEGLVQNITVLVPPQTLRGSATAIYDKIAQNRGPIGKQQPQQQPSHIRRAPHVARQFVVPAAGAGGFAAAAPPPAPPCGQCCRQQQAANVYQPNAANPGFVGPIVPQPGGVQPLPPQPIYGTPEPIPLLVDPEWLDAALMNRRQIRLLDATPSQQRFEMDYRQFRDEYYGRWDRLFAERANVEFQRSHIPTAIHFNFDIATYPAWNDNSALYPPDLFMRYVQRLGINQNEHIVVYARGPLGGMLSAARVWAMFRIYGHHQISIVNGGFEAWRNANFTLTDIDAPIEAGNWTAGWDPSLVMTYEDLTSPEADGYCILNRLCWFNFIDARPKMSWYGLVRSRDSPLLLDQQQQQLSAFGPDGFNANFNLQNRQNELIGGLRTSNGGVGGVGGSAPNNVPRRSHVPYTLSLPAEDLVRPDGFLLTIPELQQKLKQAGYMPGRESVAAGDDPAEASMVVLALAITQDVKARWC